MRRDFTLDAYEAYVGALKARVGRILRFDEFMSEPQRPEAFCLIRHDVDRKPLNALEMAKLENRLNIRSTYYFRTKGHTFVPEVIQAIHSLQHEIGYHYESLSDADGRLDRAMVDFEVNLTRLREIVPIKTCSMHGRPLSRYDNRDIFRVAANHRYLKQKLCMLGEVYVDIDYSDVAYIGDTGRNWHHSRANLRDKVDSWVDLDFETGQQLLHYFKKSPHPRIIFQVHPERWTNNSCEWFCQYAKDITVNQIKQIVRRLRNCEARRLFKSA